MPRIVSTIGEGYYFPLGISYISTAMKQAGFNVFNLNLNHINGIIEDIISNEIIKNNIDVVMTGGLSFQYNSLKNIIDCVHNKFSQIKIIVGGGIITGEPKIAMVALEYVDVGVIGEGEITSVELCNVLQENTDTEALSKIAGIIYNNNGNWTQTKPRKEIENLDSLPFPDYNGFGLDKYLDMPPMSTLNTIKDKSFFVLSSRSCPYQCTFCFHTVGKKYRQHSIKRIVEEIKILKEYGVKYVMMSDELFAINKKRVLEFSEKMQQLSMSYYAQFRVDDIDDELIDIIKRTKSCTCVGLGLESADNRILRSMRKKTTVEQIDRALKLTYEAGIPTTGNFIFGDIEETIETAANTLNYCEKHNEYNISLNFINVYPGTYLYKYALDKGIIKNPVQFLKDGCPQINVSKLSDDDLSYVAQRMLYLTGDNAVFPKDWIMLDSDKTGRISLKGKCEKCGAENIWKNAKLLCGNNWINCSACGQRHTTPLPDELKAVLLKNISNMFNCKNKIAVWGITKDSWIIFNDNDIFKNENIIFLDNSVQKQMIKIHGKKVYSPDELLAGEIDTVVFFYPNSYAVIAEEVKRKYPNVKSFINVYDLLVNKENT